MNNEFSIKPPEGMGVSKLQKILKDLIEEIPIQIQLQNELAKLTRAKYLALINQGFTKEEALTLCK